MNISAIIVAGGNGSRSQLTINKVLYKLNDKTVLEHTVQAFLGVSEIDEIVIAVSENDKTTVDELFKNCKIVKTVIGGNTRTQSVKNALNAVSGEMVLIHDGARPFVSNALIERSIESVKTFGSGICAVSSEDTLGKVENGCIESTARNGYVRIQTPQAFLTEEIKKAYSQISEADSFTDDSAVYKKFFHAPHVVEGEKSNVKLTYPEDFKTKFKVGNGFDLHKLVEGRKLILGGIEIPHVKGLLGHSDADVLTHAIMDALLSACSLRDIGYHFPDTDEKYKGICSIELLKKVLELIKNEGYAVSNISACIMAEKPKLMKYVPEISTNLANVIHISTKDLGITCTTLEGLGIVGREEGIAVSATCAVRLIEK